MNKYYIRFNPGHIKNRSDKPWVVLEVFPDSTYQRTYLDGLDIDVPVWTETSREDLEYWNIACHGYLQIVENRGKISNQE